MAPLLAEQVLRVERLIASGAFAAQSLAPDLLLQLHHEIAGALVPEWAGRWRDAEVRVGEHHPPPPYRVPMLIDVYSACWSAMKAADTANQGDETARQIARLARRHPFVHDFCRQADPRIARADSGG
jgi:fido (protein-threonine AMPylation protein)